MSLQIVMSAAVENGMRKASVEFARGVIKQLHSEGLLTCDTETAVRMFDFDSVSIASKRSVAMKKVRAGQKSSEKPACETAIRSKPEMTIPFCGIVESSWCQGVRFNKGLHTQCTNGPGVVPAPGTDDCKYCKTCQKSAVNSNTCKPQYGDISDRLTGALLEYRDPKGKLTTCYANVAEKEGWNLDRAQEVATAYGWTIPEDQLTVKVKKTGRPASTKPKKKVGKKGRPAKVKTSEEMTMDDQIAKLVAEAADDVLSVTSESSVKKVVRVKKAKKVKKVKKAKKPKKTDEQKAQEAEAKKAEAEAKKLLKVKEAEEKKLLKAKEAEEKKLLKAQEAEAKKVAKKAEAETKKLAKKAEAEAKKVLKSKEAEEKKLAKKAEAEAKKVLKAKEAEEKKLVKKAEAEAKKLLKAKAVEDEKKADLKPELTVEAVEELQATIAEEDDDEEEDEIVLDESTPKVEIEGTEYYMTKAYGLSAVLFDLEGECIGAYDETTGEIQELSFEE